MPVYYKALIKTVTSLNHLRLGAVAREASSWCRETAQLQQKIYSHGKAPKEKLYQMLKMPLAQKSDYIAWPQDILFIKQVLLRAS